MVHLGGQGVLRCAQDDGQLLTHDTRPRSRMMARGYFSRSSAALFSRRCRVDAADA